MRAALLSALVMLVPLAACGTSTSTAPTPKPQTLAEKLAADDGGKHPVADYQAAIDALRPKCKDQSDAQMQGVARGVAKIYREHNITDEDELGILQHVAQSVPDGAPQMDCNEQAGVYATLRTGGH